MPLWALDVEKSMGGEYWTNRYILETATLAEATAPAGQIVAAERAIHLDLVTFERYRISDQVPNTDNYVVVPLGSLGLVAAAGSEWLPLFNVVRVDFSPASGRPSRKYLRLPLTDGQVVNGKLTTTHRGIFQDNYAAVVLAVGAYVDVDGQDLVTAQVHPNVGMRQLRRGSKRNQPVLP